MTRIDTPDTGHRFFNEHRVTYGSHGCRIGLYRRDWQGEAVEVAHLDLDDRDLDDRPEETTLIPGDDSDPNSQERVLRLELRLDRLPALLALITAPGWKRIFVNEESDEWWITVYGGHGPGVAEADLPGSF